MNAASPLDGLLALRRLRERRAAAEAAEARAAAARAAEAREDAVHGCTAFAAERRAREDEAYAGMAGQAVPVRALHGLAARLAEDAHQAGQLDARQGQAEAALAKAEEGVRRAARAHAASRRDAEALGSLLDQLAAAARARDEAREEQALEEAVRPPLR